MSKMILIDTQSSALPNGVYVNPNNVSAVFMENEGNGHIFRVVLVLGATGRCTLFENLAFDDAEQACKDVVKRLSSAAKSAAKKEEKVV